MRGAKAQNTTPEMAGFREALLDGGFNKSTVGRYCSGVKKYMEAGFPLDPEFASGLEGNPVWNNISAVYRTGVRKYMDYISGKPLNCQVEMRHHDNVCDYDCFNCKYDDCIK